MVIFELAYRSFTFFFRQVNVEIFLPTSVNFTAISKICNLKLTDKQEQSICKNFECRSSREETRTD